MSLSENERRILDVIRRFRINPGDGIPIQSFLSITPADARNAAITSLVDKEILTERNRYLFVTPEGEQYI